jgi:hypothetical protein
METQLRRMNGAQWIQAVRAFSYIAEGIHADAGEVLQVEPRLARELIKAGLAKKYQGDSE